MFSIHIYMPLMCQRSRQVCPSALNLVYKLAIWILLYHNSHSYMYVQGISLRSENIAEPARHLSCIASGNQFEGVDVQFWSLASPSILFLSSQCWKSLFEVVCPLGMWGPREKPECWIKWALLKSVLEVAKLTKRVLHGCQEAVKCKRERPKISLCCFYLFNII